MRRGQQKVRSSATLPRAGTRRDIASHAVTTVHYIVEREVGLAAANMGVSDLLQVLDLVPLESANYQRALALGLKDYSDDVNQATGRRNSACVPLPGVPTRRSDAAGP